MPSSLGVMNISDIEEHFSVAHKKLRVREMSFPIRDPRRQKARDLDRYLYGWEADIECLNVIWSRWKRDSCATDRPHLTRTPEDASGQAGGNSQVEHWAGMTPEFRVDVLSFHYFAENLLDHIAESIGLLTNDVGLKSHAVLVRSETLPDQLQQIAIQLQVRVGMWSETQEALRDLGAQSAAGIAPQGDASNKPKPVRLEAQDLTRLLKSLQTYAIAMAEFIADAVKSPWPRGEHPRGVSQKRRRLALVCAMVVSICAVLLVIPSWTCVPTMFDEVLDSGELSPPLPASCLPASQGPSEAVLKTLENRREERGLILQRVVTCKMSPRQSDPQWQNFYIDKTLEHGRHIFLAETESLASGGVLFTVEVCLVPRWRYLKRLAGRCDAEL